MLITRRRWALLLALLSVGLMQCNSDPQSPEGGPRRIVVIDSADAEPYNTAREAMVEALRQAGFVDGGSIEIVRHEAENDEARARALCDWVASEAPAVLVVNGTVAARAARATLWGSDLPVVFTSVTDPVGETLIDDFDIAPPSNMTGVSYGVPIHMRFNVIKKRFPHDRDRALRVGLVHSSMPQSRGYRRLVEAALDGAFVGDDELKTYARLAGFEVVFREVPFVAGPDGLDAMVAAAREQVRAIDGQVDLFVSPSDILGTSRPYAEMVARSASKPLIGLGRDDVVQRWGALGSIYPSVPDIGKQAAVMVERLLEGEPVSAIRPETPVRTGYALDLAVADRFGIPVPQEVLDLIRPEDLVR